MKLLISSEEIIEIAFNYKDQFNKRVITDHLINTAQLKFLKPTLGLLYNDLLKGNYVFLFPNILSRR
ncbi:MAG: hypothetical protein LUF90_08040 [Rikenellaceae bacterium]|nr:hypothetical protein [Rikenellaceae bacterium]